MQLAGSEHGVFVEELVEIAEAEQQQGMGVSCLNRLVLLHQGCGCLDHEGVVRNQDSQSVLRFQDSLAKNRPHFSRVFLDREYG